MICVPPMSVEPLTAPKSSCVPAPKMFRAEIGAVDTNDLAATENVVLLAISAGYDDLRPGRRGRAAGWPVHQPGAARNHRADIGAAAADDLGAAGEDAGRMAVPPERTASVPPLDTVVSSAVPPVDTSSVPPPRPRAGRWQRRRCRRRTRHLPRTRPCRRMCRRRVHHRVRRRKPRWYRFAWNHADHGAGL